MLEKNSIKIGGLSAMIIIIALLGFLQNLVYRRINDLKLPGNIAIENIFIKDEAMPYSIKNGKIYQDGREASVENEKIKEIKALALFAVWSKQDPLFYSITLDTDNMAEALTRLKKNHDAALSLLKMHGKLYPLDFLEKFNRSSAQYAKFKNKVSLSDARGLLQSMEEARQAYENDINEILEMLDSSFKEEDKNKKIVLSSGKVYVDWKIAVDDLKKIKTNSEIVKKEIEERGKCLNKNFLSCRLPAGKKLEAGQAIEKEFAGHEVISERTRATLATNDFAGPFRVSTSCFGDDNDHAFYQTNICPDWSGHCYEWSVLADDRFYARTSPSSTSFSADLWKKGIPILSISASAPYGCSDLEFEPELKVTSLFYGQYGDKRLFGISDSLDGSKADFIDQARTAESRFFTEKYPSFHQLDILADYYLRAHQDGIFNDAGLAEESLARHTLIKEKMWDFDKIINRVSYHLGNYYDNNNFPDKIDSASLGEAFFILTRMNYSIMFLDFSPNVWRIADRPKYLDNLDGKDEMVMARGRLDYRQALEIYGKDKLEEWEAYDNMDLHLNDN